MALAHLLGGIDALTVKRRRHADIGDENLWPGRGGTADDLVIVGSHTEYPHVGVPLDEGTHTLAHDQVVVGEEDTDRVPPGRVTLLHLPSCRTPGTRLPVGRHAERWWW